jgi:hypothetical protein
MLRPSFAAFDRLRANILHGPPPLDLSERPAARAELVEALST